MKRFSGVLCATFAAVLVVGASSAFAGVTRVVANSPSTCANKPNVFSTIQAAVNASAANDKIKVCAGTYTEQVAIPAGKHGLTLLSDQHWLAIIQAPAAMSSPKAIVRVTGSLHVTIKDFTIQGPGDGGCDSLEFGVRIDGGASANVLANHIAHIRDQPFSGCQNGVGIQAGRAADSTTGTVTAKDNVIDDYQKNGMTISNTGSMGMVTHNTVTGAGPTAVIAQNGIQVSSGAAGQLRDNTVTGNKYSPATTTSTGILLFGPLGTVTVNKNHLNGNDVGVYAYAANAATTISENTTTGSTWDGITLDSSSGSLVKANHTNTGDFGIGLYGTSNAKVMSNSAANNATYGFYAASDTSGNLFQDDAATGSGTLNCRDESVGTVTFGTKNTWKKSTGGPANPLGICFP